MRYPIHADVEGKVFIQFVIEKDGRVTNVLVIRGIHKEADTIAVELMEKSPKWMPARHQGQLVRQKFTLPISFNL